MSNCLLFSKELLFVMKIVHPIKKYALIVVKKLIQVELNK